MTITDVNTAFATEKTDQLATQRAARDNAIKAAADKAAWLDEQLASGKVAQIGPSRYRYTQGWDAGETFTVNLNAATGVLEEIVPQHGLDTTTGQAALYTAVPAWHELGNVIPGGTTSISEVLALGGIGYGVEKRAVRYGWDGEVHTLPGKYVTVRDDTGAGLGVVGERYTVIQNRRIFEFLEALVNEHGVVWESAGALADGARVFVSMRVPETVIVDEGGLNDEITLFIVAINSHDGSTAASTVVTPWRPVCGNTERFALRDAKSRWTIRHTSGALDRINEARRTLGLTVTYADVWAAEETALARTDLAVADFHKVIGDLWPTDEDAPKRALTLADNRRTALDSIFRAEWQRAGRTAYAAERSVTDYLDHVAPRRPGRNSTEEIARAAALIDGSDDELKTRAHRRLMTLVRR